MSILYAYMGGGTLCTILTPYLKLSSSAYGCSGPQIVTAKSMASMLSGIPLSARGPAQIFIFDIHALQERFYFTDLVIPR